LGCLIFGIVLVVGIVGLGYVMTTATPSITVSPGGTLAPGGTSVAPTSGGATGKATLSGTDDQTGPPFALSGGDYVLTWSATSSLDANSGSPFGVFIENAAGEHSSSSVTTEIPGGKTRSGTEYVYGLPGDEYHFKVITTHATWQVSIAPR
jgi:hypothetical protein